MADALPADWTPGKIQIPTTTRKAHVTTAAFIVPKRVRWLWDGRIPIGEITLIAGKGGIGKSTLLAWLIADITNGEMEGEHVGVPRDVIYVANEDSLDCTVAPRLIAAGADMTRVHFMRMQDVMGGKIGSLNLPLDCDTVSEVARDYNAAAIFLDPMSSNLKLAKGTNDPAMRTSLEDIRLMAEKAGIAVVALAHLRKMTTNNIMDAISGNAEFGNVVRAIMGAVYDPDSEEGDRTFVLSQEKNNLGRMDIPSYRYRILSKMIPAFDGERLDTSRIDIIEQTDTRASDIMEDAASGAGRVGEAGKWIIDYLASQSGEAPAKDVLKAAQAEGIAQATLYRAADRVKIVKKRASQFQPTSTWAIPLTTSQKRDRERSENTDKSDGTPLGI